MIARDSKVLITRKRDTWLSELKLKVHKIKGLRLLSFIYAVFHILITV